MSADEFVRTWNYGLYNARFDVTTQPGDGDLRVL